jgi:hypothetical protein
MLAEQLGDDGAAARTPFSHEGEACGLISITEDFAGDHFKRALGTRLSVLDVATIQADDDCGGGFMLRRRAPVLVPFQSLADASRAIAHRGGVRPA